MGLSLKPSEKTLSYKVELEAAQGRTGIAVTS